MRPGPAVLTDPAEARAAFLRPLPEGFYDRPTVEVALDLVGQIVLRADSGGLRTARIVETEAYPAGDLANHASLGPTLRNLAMFGPPGTLYVYRIHQVHCMNAVTGHGSAVLLRAAEPGLGVEKVPTGPGRLCRALGIGAAENGTSLTRGDVRIAQGPRRLGPVDRGVRVGISRDMQRRWRFALRGDPWVSAPRLKRSDRPVRYRSFAQS